MSATGPHIPVAPPTSRTTTAYFSFASESSSAPTTPTSGIAPSTVVTQNMGIFGRHFDKESNHAVEHAVAPPATRRNEKEGHDIPVDEGNFARDGTTVDRTEDPVTFPVPEPATPRHSGVYEHEHPSTDTESEPDDVPEYTPRDELHESPLAHSSSLRNRAPVTGNGYPAEVKRSPTVGTSTTKRTGSLKKPAALPPRGPTTPHNRAASGTFGKGAGASGPANEPDHNASLHARAATAESTLSPEAKLKIAKKEVKEAKRISKIVKSEAKSEQKVLDKAIKELGKLESVQKKAAHDESKALSAHSKAVKEEHKLNMAYLSAKAKWEQAAAHLKGATEILDETRNRAQAQTEMLAQKAREVDQLRTQKATDDREREARLASLSDPSKH